MDEELDKMAFMFFKLFAQYESYLKTNGYFSVANNGTINVDWDRFVNEKIGATYIKQLGDNANSANYILNQPPKKQAVDAHGRITWVDASSREKSVQVLFGHISRTRNNLFHGAKFHETWFSPKRSKKLICHGLVVLENFKGLVGLK